MIASPPSPIREENHSISDWGNFRIKVLDAGKEAPVVYLQHGMSANGINDPRILTLATHLRNSGATVYLPELSEVKQLRISTETVPKIRDIFRFLVERVRAPISFLSASFSAGMGMVALSGAEEQKFLKSSLLVGTYFDFSQTLPFTLSNYDTDPYAVHVLLYNFIAKMRPDLSYLEEFYYETALDNGLKRVGNEAKSLSFEEKLGIKEKEFVSQVRKDPKFRESLNQGILDHLPPGFILKNSPRHFLENWKSSIALLHGFDDAVIAPVESENLYNMLENRSGLESVFLKSKLITHGDHLPFYTQLGEIPKLAGLWGFFLKKTGL